MGTHYGEFRRRFFPLFRRIALLAAILSTGGSAAASILLLPSPEPDEWSDISISGVIGMYSGGVFVITGLASGFDVGPGDDPDFTFGANFGITAAIDSAGNVSSPGSLSIGPPSVPLGPPGSYPTSLPLLHGTITDAQFQTDGVLQLEFVVTSGSAAGDFGGVGAFGGVIINMVTGTNFPGSSVVPDPMIGPPGVPFNSPANGPGDFEHAFTLTTFTADVIGGEIPEPSAWMVWSAIVGCVLLAKHVSRAHNIFAALSS